MGNTKDSKKTRTDALERHPFVTPPHLDWYLKKKKSRKILSKQHTCRLLSHSYLSRYRRSYLGVLVSAN